MKGLIGVGIGIYSASNPIGGKFLEAKNQEVAEWLGVPYQEWMTKGVNGKVYFHSQPNFIANPIELLLLMRERKDWRAFLYKKIEGTSCSNQEIKSIECVPVDLILDTTGELLEAAYEWLKQNQNDG